MENCAHGSCKKKKLKKALKKKIGYWEWDEDAYPEILSKFLLFHGSVCGV
jgi:hypothetical protein